MGNGFSVGSIINGLIDNTTYPGKPIREIIHKLYLRSVRCSIQVIFDNAAFLDQSIDNLLTHASKEDLYAFIDRGIRNALKTSGYLDKLNFKELDFFYKAFREDIIEVLQTITSKGRMLNGVSDLLNTKAAIQSETLAKSLPSSLQNKLIRLTFKPLKPPKPPKSGGKGGKNIFQKFFDLFKPKNQSKIAQSAGETLSKTTTTAAEIEERNLRLLSAIKGTKTPSDVHIAPKGNPIPPGSILLSLGVDVALTVVMMSYPSDAATLSDRIYYGYKDTLLKNYNYDNLAFGEAFDFYSKNIFSNNFRAKFSLFDFSYEYTQLARSYKKHALDNKTLFYIASTYLKFAKTNKRVKFTVEELVNAYKWYNKLNNPKHISFEDLLALYNKLPYNFHDIKYLRELNIDLEAGEGDFILKKVLAKMYDYILLNKFKVKLTQKQKD